MGWRTDWLHGLIFTQVRQLWARVRSDAEAHPALLGPAPELFVVRQMADGDPRRSKCLPPVRREWLYRGERFEAAARTRSEASRPATLRTLLYDLGRVDFHITPDRRQVIFVYVLGPRYGRGLVYRAVGQGRGGRLVEADGCAGWTA